MGLLWGICFWEQCVWLSAFGQHEAKQCCQPSLPVCVPGCVSRTGLSVQAARACVNLCSCFLLRHLQQSSRAACFAEGSELLQSSQVAEMHLLHALAK